MRLKGRVKAGFYPTPEKTLQEVKRWLSNPQKTFVLDPCCGEGEALHRVVPESYCYGIELDDNRANRAKALLGEDKVISASVFDISIIPLECFGLLWLNPPYDTGDGERVEFTFLKHTIRWLARNGVLVYIVPERLFEKRNIRTWLSLHLRDIKIMRIHPDEFPEFKQVVLFGYKKDKKDLKFSEVLPPPYPFITECQPEPYDIPLTPGPKVFQHNRITEKDIENNYNNLWKYIYSLKPAMFTDTISPLFPLRKGHLTCLIATGALDGRIDIPGGYLVIKGFSSRASSSYETDEHWITVNTYTIGIRVIDTVKKQWYDLQ